VCCLGRFISSLHGTDKAGDEATQATHGN